MKLTKAQRVWLFYSLLQHNMLRRRTLVVLCRLCETTHTCSFIITVILTKPLKKKTFLCQIWTFMLCTDDPEIELNILGCSGNSRGHLDRNVVFSTGGPAFNQNFCQYTLDEMVNLVISVVFRSSVYHAPSPSIIV